MNYAAFALTGAFTVFPATAFACSTVGFAETVGASGIYRQYTSLIDLPVVERSLG